MLKFRMLLLGIVAAVGLTALAAPVGAAAADAPPFKVKIATFDGKPKIKVAKKLRVVASCSHDCVANVKITLATLTGRFSVRGKQQLGATQNWITGMVLTKSGLKVLKKYQKDSFLKVTLRARSLETGKVRRLTKIFRFRR